MPGNKNSSLAAPSFDWTSYLSETNTKPAPQSCFKQAETAPSNEFPLNTKLEAQDPRSSTSMCIATVVGLQGPRLRLRLDGSDNKNDFWRLVDSTDIRPVGSCEKDGNLLQPPLGFRMNASSWPMFLMKTLKDAEMAAESAFKPQPPTPPINNFRVGMKLEAVDRKNQFLICPATVGKVEGSLLFITFDGWSGAFDYWCEYDSRDIFPVGWCAKTGHYLQPPGQPKVRRPSVSPSITSPVQLMPLTVKIEPDTSSSSNHSSHTATVFLNSSCVAGPYISPHKLSNLPSQVGPSTPRQVLQDLAQTCINCSIQPKTVFSFFKSFPAGTDSLKVTYGDNHLETFLKVPETVDELWRMVEKLCESLICCENFFSLKLVQGICAICARQDAVNQNNNTPKPSLLSPVKRMLSSEALEVSNNQSHKCQRTISTEAASSTTESKPNQRPSSSDPSLWTIDEVIRFVVDHDPNMAQHTELFKKQEIDGRAFLLLSSDMMMKYMGLKLGPALKLCSLIDKLKIKRLAKY